MLSEQLSIAHKSLSEAGYEVEQINEVINFISKFKGTYLYPRVLKRKFNIEMIRVYEILNQLVKFGVLNLAFEIYCNKCDKFQNDIYDKLNEIPRNISCEYCGKDINLQKDIIVIYKVNNNE